MSVYLIISYCTIVLTFWSLLWLVICPEKDKLFHFMAVLFFSTSSLLWNGKDINATLKKENQELKQQVEAFTTKDKGEKEKAHKEYLKGEK